MTKNNLYILILVLIVIILLQGRSCKPVPPEIIERVDTVVVNHYIRHVIQIPPKLIEAKIDTSIWMKKEENKPDTTYKGLLTQYEKLGNSHFTTNTFSTEFKIADYGSVTVNSEVKANWLINNTLETNLIIPTTTITIEKETQAPLRNQLYIGGELTANKEFPISGAYGSLLLKTKKDRIYNLGLGYHSQNPEIKIGSYWKIKLK